MICNISCCYCGNVKIGNERINVKTVRENKFTRHNDQLEEQMYLQECTSSYIPLLGTANSYIPPFRRRQFFT